MNLASITTQAICAYALRIQDELWSSAGSCNCLTVAASRLVAGEFVKYRLQTAYREQSNANLRIHGFRHISEEGWGFMPSAAKQTYRLEMLYYFWMANQDSMDAFS